jgi:hypothetical protein
MERPFEAILVGYTGLIAPILLNDFVIKANREERRSTVRKGASQPSDKVVVISVLTIEITNLI